MFNKWNKEKSVDDKNYLSPPTQRGNLTNRYVRPDRRQKCGRTLLCVAGLV